MNTRTVMTLLLSGALVMAPLVSRSEPAATMTAEAVLLHVPSVDYRRDWVLLGSFSILADDPEEGAKQLHVVYAQREAVDAYVETGAFPDGAVLVKVRHAYRAADDRHF
jgi:Cytochrome P460